MTQLADPLLDLYLRLEPLGRIFNFMDDGWTVWDCSPIYGPAGEGGEVHLFATRWRHDAIPDRPDATWYLGSEIVHAVAPRPEGPYELRDVVIAGDGSDRTWDASAVINAKIYQFDGRYVIAYTGCSGSRHDTQAIGLLAADSLDGPWTRLNVDAPAIAPAADRSGFDGYICNNPSLVREPGTGRYRLYYKGRDVVGWKDGRPLGGVMRIGLATADQLEGPWTQHPASPVIDLSPKSFEDPCVWTVGDRYYMLCSDVNVVDRHGGILFQSADGIAWEGPMPGYPGPDLLWGRNQRLEEPNLLVASDGRPTHLFNVLGECPEDPAYSGHVFRIREP